jgi:hypothetical protein
MSFDDLYAPPERELRSATIFVPTGREIDFIELCSEFDASIMAIRKLAPPFRGISVDVDVRNEEVAFSILGSWCESDRAKTFSSTRKGIR